MSAFDDAFEALIGVEKGYVVDNGGPTMYGVTQAVARANGYTGDMRNLPLSTAKAIAKAKYWDVYRCDELDPRIGFQVFDAAYNGGYVVKWLQQASGAAADGKFGPDTLAAVKATDPDKLIARFDAYRLLYMADLDVWPTYGRGWARRVANNILKGMQ
jgi:lysozyme family protein